MRLYGILALSLSHCDLLLCCCNHLVGFLFLLVIVMRFFASHRSTIKGSMNANLDSGVVIHNSADAMLRALLSDCISSHCADT